MYRITIWIAGHAIVNTIDDFDKLQDFVLASIANKFAFSFEYVGNTSCD